METARNIVTLRDADHNILATIAHTSEYRANDTYALTSMRLERGVCLQVGGEYFDDRSVAYVGLETGFARELYAVKSYNPVPTALPGNQEILRRVITVQAR